MNHIYYCYRFLTYIHFLLFSFDSMVQVDVEVNVTTDIAVKKNAVIKTAENYK